MDSIVNQIISIEDKAQEIIKDAKAKQEEILAQTEEDCKKIEQDICSRRQKRLDLLTKNEQELASKKIAEIEAENKKKTQMLNDRYQQKKNDWVNEIYENIIGR